jgi:glutaconate CoA-transferase subunit B
MSVISCEYTREEMMTVAAARKFKDRVTCFVGVGQPSVAACLARRLHAPNIILVYESGAIDAKPTVPPLSIADPELSETASFIVSVPEIFNYWLQGGRIEMAFLGAAQIDRSGNLNTTVIGDYRSPKVRLPGAGGAPQIAANAREVIVILQQSPKAFVREVDFLTTARSNHRTTVVTDLGILEYESSAGELVLTSLHQGVSVDEIQEATGWPLAMDKSLSQTPAPTGQELSVLRQLR